MTQVYRMEQPNGKGPFSDWSWRGEVSAWMPHFNALPTPYEEPNLMSSWRRGVEFLGTLTPQCLLMWFPEPVTRALERHNYHLIVYDVPESALKKGQYQVAFDKCLATRLQVLRPTELFTLATGDGA